MADNDKPAGCYAPVSGDGGRASGLIRRRIAEEDGGGGGFLDLSLGSIYNTSSSVADDGLSQPVARALFPPLADASSTAVPSVVVAAADATAAYAPSAPASHAHASAFALGLAASAVPGDGRVLLRAPKATVAVANLLPPLFASIDGSGAVPVPVHVPVHGNGTAGATTPAPRSKRAAALMLGAPPPSSSPSRKAPRGRRGDATGRRRRSGGGDALAPTNDGESAPPPFPWATKTAGAHPTLAELIERGIGSVEGEVRCKRCDAGKTISYEIRAKFEELSRFIVRNVEAMHDRAPPEWMYPALPDCDKCGQKNSLRPVIAAEKWRINWMFLLLGQTLGLCTLEQLKHFCERTRQHRTGAKDRVLYSTYMELCNQLCPGGPFDMASERKNRTRPFA